jgi:hypothetical protein
MADIGRVGRSWEQVDNLLLLDVLLLLLVVLVIVLDLVLYCLCLPVLFLGLGLVLASLDRVKQKRSDPSFDS